jgi:membrane-bound lytic murein transglycosylase B
LKTSHNAAHGLLPIRNNVITPAYKTSLFSVNSLFVSLSRARTLLTLSTVLLLNALAFNANAEEEDVVAKLVAENEANFAQCLITKSAEALSAGVSQSRVYTEFGRFSFIPRVIELDRSQPEFVSTFSSYFSKRVNEWRIKKGSEKYAQHREFLKTLTTKYGIPGHYLISFWGLETNYGGFKGTMSTLDSLATLACDKRRSKFFSNELFLALKLMDSHDLSREGMKGSWAGAMGHTQFMPTTYTNYAIDGDGDGKVDLWNSEKDALASGANFLWQLGWERGLRWGREVRLPQKFNYQLANKEVKTIAQWKSLGIVHGNGDELPNSDIKARLRLPAGHEGPAFLTYANFRTIMRWNNSEFYAIAVGQLANQIAGGGGLYATLPDLPNFKISDIAKVQVRLIQLGYDVGGVDGIMGPATREGIRQFQAQNGLVADGFPSPTTVEAVLNNQ